MKKTEIINMANSEVEIIENCGHNISAEASTLALKFIRENLNK